MMRQVCILMVMETNQTYYHCQGDICNGRGWLTYSYRKFFHSIIDSRLIFIHAFCSSANESKHDNCRSLGRIDAVNYCRLVPQAKITGILHLNNEAEKRKHLQLINEPYYRFCGWEHYNNLSLYSCIAEKCDIDSIDITPKKVFMCITCPICKTLDYTTYTF